ncbi:serine hydrolase [Colwellia marinimaniae]|uniref:serine hydrolase n=1 Tax=Colwellia marinimaniae TaxID=1513592 RepID=UPI0027380950|nr:serine hydrolase [Colwellia marinimaniae]
MIQHGKVVFTSAYGVIDRINNQAINSKTLFQIGSHSKAITSMIALELFHGGDLDGFGSEYRFSPEHGVGVVMLTSSGGKKFINFAIDTMAELLADVVDNDNKPSANTVTD